jgi:hypothetical protein
MFEVFREHATPSAVLMFNAGPSHGEAIGSYRGDPLYHASLDPAEYAKLLGGIGFNILAHVVEDPQAGGQDSLARAVAWVTAVSIRRGSALQERWVRSRPAKAPRAP